MREVSQENTNLMNPKNENQELKYLAVHAVVLISNLYESIKKRSGALGYLILALERVISSILRPFYNKLSSCLSGLLLSINISKMEDATNKFNEHAPRLAKKVARRAWFIAQSTWKWMLAFISEAQTNGALATAKGVGTKCWNYLRTMYMETHARTVLRCYVYLGKFVPLDVVMKVYRSKKAYGKRSFRPMEQEVDSEGSESAYEDRNE